MSNTNLKSFLLQILFGKKQKIICLKKSFFSKFFNLIIQRIVPLYRQCSLFKSQARYKSKLFTVSPTLVAQHLWFPSSFASSFSPYLAHLDVQISNHSIGKWALINPMDVIVFVLLGSEEQKRVAQSLARNKRERPDKEQDFWRRDLKEVE